MAHAQVQVQARECGLKSLQYVRCTCPGEVGIVTAPFHLSAPATSGFSLWSGHARLDKDNEAMQAVGFDTSTPE